MRGVLQSILRKAKALLVAQDILPPSKLRSLIKSTGKEDYHSHRLNEQILAEIPEIATVKPWSKES